MHEVAGKTRTLVVTALLSACTASAADDDPTNTSNADTEETGDVLIPEGGVYQATVTSKTGMCRAEEEAATWKLTMPVPPGGGEWELTEEYSGDDPLRQAPLPCDLDQEADLGICRITKDRDYAAEDMGILATVTAQRYFELAWTTPTELTGIVQVDLRCAGSSCDGEPAATYLVNEWDCLTEAEFTAELIE